MTSHVEGWLEGPENVGVNEYISPRDTSPMNNPAVIYIYICSADLQNESLFRKPHAAYILPIHSSGVNISPFWAEEFDKA